MEKIVNGLLKFQEDVYPAYKDDFRRLGTGQTPMHCWGPVPIPASTRR